MTTTPTTTPDVPLPGGAFEVYNWHDVGTDGEARGFRGTRCDTCRVTAKASLPVRTNLGGRSSPSQCGSRKVTR